MAKLIVQHDTDPGIAIVIEDRARPANAFESPWYCGKCTQCGWELGDYCYSVVGSAVAEAEIHVDKHEAADA